MTDSAQDADAALVRSLTAVWKSYLDQESAALEATIRPWAVNRRPSTVWEAHRQNLALSIAWFLAEIAGRPFARLYQSSLLADRMGAADRL